MWKLMHDNAISETDRKNLADYVINVPKLTAGEKVKEFEKKWSEWLGVKHSVFVNSGSSANLILVQAAIDLYGQRNWSAQSCTWATNISPIIQLNKNCGLYLTDTDLVNLGPNLEDLEIHIKSYGVKYLFVTHVLGFPAISEQLLSLCTKHNVMLFEDCCESHGSTWNGKKVGTFGKASTFSFYYGHHMTTIEGGMVCTDDDEFYERLILLRSHGMLRELPLERQEQLLVDGVDRRFTFLCSGYNVRNTDLHASLGISQMSRLEKSIEIRNNNLKTFLDNIDSNKYYTGFNRDGVSLYAFPIIHLGKDTKSITNILTENNIENRPLIAGNLLRHPMCKNSNSFIFPIYSDCKTSEFMHEKSFYVGNNEFVTTEDVIKLCQILNKIN